jgi:hypothetical protein
MFILSRMIITIIVLIGYIPIMSIIGHLTTDIIIKGIITKGLLTKGLLIGSLIAGIINLQTEKHKEEGNIMGIIYTAPKEIPEPDISKACTLGWDKYNKLEQEYVEKVRAWAKKNGKSKEAGEEVVFPVGDGNARYIVLSLRPVKLIHLAVGDAWEFKYAHRLTAQDIRDELNIRGARINYFQRITK